VRPVWNTSRNVIGSRPLANALARAVAGPGWNGTPKALAVAWNVCAVPSQTGLIVANAGPSPCVMPTVAVANAPKRVTTGPHVSGTDPRSTRGVRSIESESIEMSTGPGAGAVAWSPPACASIGAVAAAIAASTPTARRAAAGPPVERATTSSVSALVVARANF